MSDMDLAQALNEVAELHNNQRYPITTRKRKAIAIVLRAAVKYAHAEAVDAWDVDDPGGWMVFVDGPGRYRVVPE